VLPQQNCWFKQQLNESCQTLDTTIRLRNGCSLSPAIYLLHKRRTTGNSAASNDCPLWFIPGDNGSCECGNDLGGVVKCNNESREAFLLESFCMSHDPTGLVVGACPYHHYISGRKDEDLYLHHLLPKNVSDLKDFMCRHLNRKG